MSGAPSIVWFRNDLRLADNPALNAAAEHGPVVAVYILDDIAPGEWKMGAASRWWLHHSLTALSASLEKLGITLVLRQGAAAEIVPALVKETGAIAVFWNRLYEPWAMKRDQALKEALTKSGVEAHSFNASLLHEPERLKTGGGTPFKVFTPFYRALKAQAMPEPCKAPGKLQAGPKAKSDRLESWKLLPTHPDWAGGMRDTWKSGEAEAKKLFTRFIDEALHVYAEDRNFPDRESTSRLSPYLHFGEVSPRQVWHALHGELAKHGKGDASADKFFSELGWREFAYYCLYHNPDMPEQPNNKRYLTFPHVRNDAHLHAWQHGRTGYPLIDAAIHQLWQTGWMHNRMRLAASSFLVKHLGISWVEGEHWFWDTLVDADLASNALGWQWIAGTGPDAAPYFRIFNPVTQSEKFDADGAYIRRYLPELAKMPAKYIHAPWTAPAEVLQQAGVALGVTYPKPIVDHATAREAALARNRNLPRGTEQ